MEKRVLAIFILIVCLFSSGFADVAFAVNLDSLKKDSKELYMHGYMVYKYNGTSALPTADLSVSIWAQSFWSKTTLVKTSPTLAGAGFVKYNSANDEYESATGDELEAIYAVGFQFKDVQPYQEVKLDVWFKLAISKIDMSGIQPGQIGTVDDAKSALGDSYQKYVDETYYWDYNNSTIQAVINEINATIAGSRKIYEIVYATINWLSTNMVYMEHEDYPHGRLRASEILNKTIDGKRYGVCRHFTEAFTAIMRGFGVPTNLYNGLVFYDMGGNIGIIFGGGHAWCEVYMPPYGWLPVEVTISDRYLRDIVRVGMISEYYYLPTYIESTNSAPKPPEKPEENFIGAYWGWSVEEPPLGTIDSLINAIKSIHIINWIMLALIIALAIDSYLIRKKIKAITHL